MNKVTSTQANRDFTKVTSLVDAEGAVVITKNGKDVYVMMRMDEYMKFEETGATSRAKSSPEKIEEMIKSGECAFWVRDGGSAVYMDPTEDDMITAIEVKFEEDLARDYTIGIFPKENIKIETDDEGEMKAVIYQRPNKGKSANFTGGDYQYLLKDDDEGKEEKALIQETCRKLKDSELKLSDMTECKIEYIWGIPQ